MKKSEQMDATKDSTSQPTSQYPIQSVTEFVKKHMTNKTTPRQKDTSNTAKEQYKDIMILYTFDNQTWFGSGLPKIC